MLLLLVVEGLEEILEVPEKDLMEAIASLELLWLYMEEEVEEQILEISMVLMVVLEEVDFREMVLLVLAVPGLLIKEIMEVMEGVVGEAVVEGVLEQQELLGLVVMVVLVEE